MSAYLYAIIPYKSEFATISHRIPELEGIQSELNDEYGFDQFKDFFLINTCYRMTHILPDKTGYSWLRHEIYKVAQTVGAKEVWYCEELAIDKMYDDESNPSYSIDNLTDYINNNRYCFIEYDIKTMKENGGISASYMHDDFHDIILR